jgi:zinc transport system substrate-binding protein
VRAFLLIALLVAATGCSRADSGQEPEVAASFYPLAWAAARVAGPGVRVSNLTPPGAEPHDFELSPRDLETLRDAKLVVYAGGGFQPSIEDAVESREGSSMDVLRAGEDPHVWLDPVRFAEVVEAIAAELGEVAEGRKTVEALKRLHTRYRLGLAECDRRVIVTTHASFGQLAKRYGLEALALAGRSPESEPGPRDLERIVAEVRHSGATTVFTEPLVSSRLAETVAREAGAAVTTLDPIEGLTDEQLAAGEDYLSVMRRNLTTLREALGCR